MWQLQMAAHLSGVQSESLRIYMVGGGGGFFNNGSLIAVVVVVVKTGYIFMHFLVGLIELLELACLLKSY